MHWLTQNKSKDYQFDWILKGTLGILILHKGSLHHPLSKVKSVGGRKWKLNLLTGEIGRPEDRGHDAVILYPLWTLIHISYRTKGIVVRSRGSYLKWHTCVPVISIGHPKWKPLCATSGKVRASLPVFWSRHTLTSKGPGTRSPKEVHCMGTNEIKGQRWRQCCQHSYNLANIYCQTWHLLPIPKPWSTVFITQEGVLSYNPD